MSSNHRRKIARALAAKTGLTYQQALEVVITAAETGLLPHTLDKAGIERAAARLAAAVPHAPGAPAPERDLLAEVLDLTHGLVVVTGGVGAGKTTFLYDCIAELASRAQVRVATVESPIEHRIAATGDHAAIWQHEYGTGPGHLSFETVHRGSLRSDPEVMMYSELRDTDEPALAFDSALTGRLTLAGMSGSTAADVFEFLLLHVEPFLITQALDAVVVMEKTQGGFTRTLIVVDDATRAHVLTLDGPGVVSRAFLNELAVLLSACPTQTTKVITVEGAERPTFTTATITSGLRISAGPVGVGKSVSLDRLVESIADTKEWTDLGYDPSVASAIATAMSAPSGMVAFLGQNNSGHTRALNVALDQQARRGRKVGITQWHHEAVLDVSHPNVWRNEYEGRDPAEAVTEMLQHQPDVVSIGFVDEEGTAASIATAKAGRLLATRMTALDARDPIDALYLLHTRYNLTPQDVAGTLTCIVGHHPSGDTSRASVVVIDDTLREVITRCLGGRGENVAALKSAVAKATIIGTTFKTITASERDDIRTGLRRLAAMLRVGMWATEACTSLAQTMSGEPQQVFQRLAAADTFGDGAAKETHVFEPWAVTMIRNGEMGSLDTTLRELVEVF